ncbi:MAG TPA: sulfatase [Steroidobacteraceae bacterium]|nr:sulfatase [Steroidobacteraceae bacterium]
MRLLYVDIDTLRADHLGCYGYPRPTSPNIDRVAAGGIVFESIYASDSPCLPSRTALLTGQFGIHNGVVNHGGTDADPAIEGASRGFHSRLHLDSLPNRLKQAGLSTVTVSSFAHRHSAFHWHAGFDESYNVGKYGMETADEVHAVAADWLRRRGREDNWFLHVHLWDPHTPYRTASAYGEPFRQLPFPAWLTEEVRARHWRGCGPHSAREGRGFAPNEYDRVHYPRQPQEMFDMAAVRAMFDGYDTGVRFADEYTGRLLELLGELGVERDTAVMISSDHGETLGELNIYCDHQTADEHTTHVPLILAWPGLGPGRYRALHYQIDVTATLLELLGQSVPASWDGESFAASLKQQVDAGRDHLVLSQGAWTCQRGVRFDQWMLISTLHGGYHLFDDVMLFDLAQDPFEQHNVAAERADVAGRGLMLLAEWHAAMLPHAARGRDPLENVIREGGPYHVRGELPKYLERLRATGRSDQAGLLQARYR